MFSKKYTWYCEFRKSAEWAELCGIFLELRSRGWELGRIGDVLSCVLRVVIIQDGGSRAVKQQVMGLF